MSSDHDKFQQEEPLGLDSKVDHFAALSARGLICETLLQLVVKEVSFDDFARELLVLVMQVIPCEASSVFEIDHDNRRIFFRAALGARVNGLRSFSIPLGQGIVGHVAESKQPLIVSELEGNALHLKAVQNAVGFEARNVMAVPLVVRGQVYGVIELLNRDAEPSFKREDVVMASYFCENAARALEVRFMLAWGASQGTGNSLKTDPSEAA